MKNKDYYSDEIIRKNYSGFGINKKTKEIETCCLELECVNCVFYSPHEFCEPKVFEWMEEEHEM